MCLNSFCCITYVNCFKLAMNCIFFMQLFVSFNPSHFCLSYKSVPILLDDIKNVQSTLHRNQSPSPSRGSSRASSSPVSSTSYISDACTSLSKAEDATTATSTSMSSSPVNAGPSSYRAQWVLSRKLSGRSRFSELQGNLNFLYSWQ